MFSFKKRRLPVEALNSGFDLIRVSFQFHASDVEVANLLLL
jgi:hypothetical protein